MHQRGSSRRRRTVVGTVVPVILGTGLLTSCGGPAFQDPWFGGYVDTTAWPPYQFAVEAVDQRRVVLSFVVADPDDACKPSWGGYFGLDEAAQRLGLDQQISAVQGKEGEGTREEEDEGAGEKEGEVVISFGGASGDELATACDDPEALYEAYRSVIDRYGITMVDVDIEGDDLGRPEASARRAEVLGRLQEAREPNAPLKVWLTLPVGPSGLDEEARDVVAQTLDGNVELAGVNLMTMNYATVEAKNRGVVATTIDAAEAAHGQLSALWAEADQPLSDDLVWNRMGITPMIGQNDIREEVLDQESAAQLAEFAREKGMGRLSFWSLNRDRPCGDDVEDVRQAVAKCSGIEQDAGEFNRVLQEVFGA